MPRDFLLEASLAKPGPSEGCGAQTATVAGAEWVSAAAGARFLLAAALVLHIYAGHAACGGRSAVWVTVDQAQEESRSGCLSGGWLLLLEPSSGRGTSLDSTAPAPCPLLPQALHARLDPGTTCPHIPNS